MKQNADLRLRIANADKALAEKTREFNKLMHEHDALLAEYTQLRRVSWRTHDELQAYETIERRDAHEAKCVLPEA